MRKRIKNLSILAIALVIGATFSFKPSSLGATVPNQSEIISLNNTNNGQGGDGDSRAPMASADGKFIAFESTASNLVMNDTNNKSDIFVRDMVSSSTSRVSVSTAGVEANDESYIQAISKTGRYIVYQSYASNLIDGETHTTGSGNFNVYVYDTQTDYTTMINKNSSGTKVYKIHVTGISDDGRYVLVNTDATNVVSSSATRKAVVLDRLLNSWELVSGIKSGRNGNTWWNNTQMSCDGSYIVVNASDGVYLSDRREQSQFTNLTPLANGNIYDPRISCDGRYIAFQTLSTNLVSGATPTDGAYHLVRYDRITGEYKYLDVNSSGNFLPRRTNSDVLYSLAIADTGGAAFALVSTNFPYHTQAYIRNVEANTTEVVTLKSVGGSSSTSYQQTSSYKLGLDKDGKYLTYETLDTSQIVANETNNKVDIIRSRTGW